MFSVSRQLSAISTLLAHERERYILWVPVCIGAGIGVYFALPIEPWIGIGPFFLLFSLLAVWNSQKTTIWFPALALSLVALGFASAQVHTLVVNTPMLHEELRFKDVQGRITDIDMQDKGKARLTLEEVHIPDVPQNQTPKRIRIALRKADSNLRIGDIISVKASLYPLPSPTAPGAYDFARTLYFEGYGGIGYALSQVHVLEAATRHAWAETLTDLRLSMAKDMLAHMGTPEGAVAAALTVGEQNTVPEYINNDMRDSGLYHILSISGLHLALASGIVFFLVRLLLSLYMPLALRLPVKKIAAMTALLSAFFYLLIAGSPVPAQRSFIMVAFVFLAILFDRKGISIYTLAWAATVLLLLKPDALLGASFQMSFAATLAIVAFYERGAGRIGQHATSVIGRLCFYFMAVALTSLAATLATAPFVIYHFSRFQVWGLLSNMVVEPLTAFWIMPGVVLTFLLWPFGVQAWGFSVMEYGIKLMLLAAKIIGHFPYANIGVPSIGVTGLCLCMAGLLWLTLWRSRLAWAGLAFVLMGLSGALIQHKPDMLISDDAQRIMLRDADGHYAMLKGTDRSFTAHAWLAMLNQDKSTPLPVRGETAINCTENLCYYRAKGKLVLVMTDWHIAKAACAEAEQADNRPDAVIALFWLRYDECAHIPLRIDRNRLQKDGAHALYMESDTISYQTAAQMRGRRPWVP